MHTTPAGSSSVGAVCGRPPSPWGAPRTALPLPADARAGVRTCVCLCSSSFIWRRGPLCPIHDPIPCPVPFCLGRTKMVHLRGKDHYPTCCHNHHFPTTRHTPPSPLCSRRSHPSSPPTLLQSTRTCLYSRRKDGSRYFRCSGLHARRRQRARSRGPERRHVRRRFQVSGERVGRCLSVSGSAVVDIAGCRCSLAAAAAMADFSIFVMSPSASFRFPFSRDSHHHRSSISLPPPYTQPPQRYNSRAGRVEAAPTTLSQDLWGCSIGAY